MIIQKKYYYFDYDYDNYEIDYNSCLEIQLIEKKDFNYSDLNLSGKQSGPFGFDIGMTYDEVKAACNGEEPQHIGDDRYYVKPIKSHPSFDRYIVWIRFIQINIIFKFYLSIFIKKYFFPGFILLCFFIVFTPLKFFICRYIVF